MQTQIDLNALADYVETTFDYHPDFEDDAFAFSFQGVRIYCERKPACFDLHVGSDLLQLPRC
ncbi:hypothetical protein F4U94_22835 [Sphingobium limneticum]|uniref:hypothetical protein n=1 Tax=Sphingobium limneticum TaxID=1007511 RepID=UPI00123CADE0|nr:hypothetical protein [Sphingobium limneticum]KAA9009663.1 hypothetical protein F4U94_22835 [Sphingobium limneticum]